MFEFTVCLICVYDMIYVYFFQMSSNNDVPENLYEPHTLKLSSVPAGPDVARRDPLWCIY